MKDEAVKRLGLILAVQAEIEGMKAENTLANRIKPMVFDLKAFQAKAEELRNIVYCHREQL